MTDETFDFDRQIQLIAVTPQLDANRLAPFSYGIRDGYDTIFIAAELAIRGSNNGLLNLDSAFAAAQGQPIFTRIQNAIRVAEERGRYNNE